MPASSNQCFYLGSYLLRQLGSKVFLSEFAGDFPQLKLPILSVFGNDFIHDDAERVNIRWSFGFENYVVLISEMLDGSVHCLIGISSY